MHIIFVSVYIVPFAIVIARSESKQFKLICLWLEDNGFFSFSR